jgi:hypothetical protein
MQDLSSFVLLASVVLIVVYFVSKTDNKLKDKLTEKPLDKVCPPHKWRYEDQPGMEEVSFIRCQICMKTPQQINESK